MSRSGIYDLKYGFIPDDDVPQEPPKQTNGDRIRSMTNEELAEIISCVGNCGDCFLHHNGCDIRMSCKGNVLEWLKKEVDDG